MIRYMTAGESHGRCLTVIIEGLPAGLEVSEDDINLQLKRRQLGYGRGRRMKIEKDKVVINSGIRFARTTGSPVSMQILNRDWDNWKKIMSLKAEDKDDEYLQVKPRPGHADLTGVLKYNSRDIRDILERASARETAARVAAGALARKFLLELDIHVASFTKQIGKIRATDPNMPSDKILEEAEQSQLRCTDKNAEKKMIEEIEKASKAGDTVGGIFSVIVDGVPPGFGAHIQWDLKLDAKIARALMSVQAVKGVENGLGFAMAGMRGSEVHDRIKYEDSGKSFFRDTNNAGGFEGGITNGQSLVFSAVMKPISSLQEPLESVDMLTKKKVFSEIVRSDVCAVPAAGVVGEAAVALELASAMLEKTGGDSMVEVKRNYKNYLKQISEF